jgi:ribokinase
MTGIVVVGSLNMDFVVAVDRLPAPGETVLGRDFQMIPGGKGANQACAAADTLCQRCGGHLGHAPARPIVGAVTDGSGRGARAYATCCSYSRLGSARS